MQTLKSSDKLQCLNHFLFMDETMQDKHFCNQFVFSDKATFHLSGKVNHHNMRIWGLKNSHANNEHVRTPQK
ncbi:hypothetical protein X975_15515, partial [Stegodyphus mimosarum]